MIILAETYIKVVLLATVVVTYLTRYLPLLALHSLKIPTKITKIFYNLPVAILTALAFQSVFIREGNLYPAWDNYYILGLITSIILSIKTNSLVIVVIGSISVLFVMNYIF